MTEERDSMGIAELGVEVAVEVNEEAEDGVAAETRECERESECECEGDCEGEGARGCACELALAVGCDFSRLRLAAVDIGGGAAAADIYSARSLEARSWC